MKKQLLTACFALFLTACGMGKNGKTTNPGFDLQDLTPIPLPRSDFESFLINSSIDTYSNNAKLRIFAVLYNFLQDPKEYDLTLNTKGPYPSSQVVVYVVNCEKDKTSVMDFIRYSKLNGAGEVSTIGEVYPTWSSFPKGSIISILRDKVCRVPIKSVD